MNKPLDIIAAVTELARECEFLRTRVLTLESANRELQADLGELEHPRPADQRQGQKPCV